MDGMPEEVQQLQLLLSISTKLDTIIKIARQKMKEPLLLLLQLASNWLEWLCRAKKRPNFSSIHSTYWPTL